MAGLPDGPGLSRRAAKHSILPARNGRRCQGMGPARDIWLGAASGPATSGAIPWGRFRGVPGLFGPAGNPPPGGTPAYQVFARRGARGSARGSAGRPLLPAPATARNPGGSWHRGHTPPAQPPKGKPERPRAPTCAGPGHEADCQCPAPPGGRRGGPARKSRAAACGREFLLGPVAP